MQRNVSNKCGDGLQLIRNADNYFLGLKPYSSYHIPMTFLKLQRCCSCSRTYRLLQTNRSIHRT